MRRLEAFLRGSRAAAVATVALVLAVGCERDPPVVARAPAPRMPAPSPAAPPKAQAPLAEGIALAIVYDTSGSMKDKVVNAAGEKEEKYKIAARAFDAIVGRLAAYQAAPSPSPRRLDVGLWIFQGAGVKLLQPLQPFDAAALKRRVAGLGVPGADTPLGEGLATAAAAVNAARLTRRHVLVVTDGINRTGRPPDVVLRGLADEARRSESSLGVHFVAFDVEAKVFEPLKQLGATVLGAADERTLSEQLGFIVEKKILLEQEEPAAAPK